MQRLQPVFREVLMALWIFELLALAGIESILSFDHVDLKRKSACCSEEPAEVAN